MLYITLSLSYAKQKSQLKKATVGREEEQTENFLLLRIFL